MWTDLGQGVLEEFTERSVEVDASQAFDNGLTILGIARMRLTFREPGRKAREHVCICAHCGRRVEYTRVGQGKPKKYCGPACHRAFWAAK